MNEPLPAVIVDDVAAGNQYQMGAVVAPIPVAEATPDADAEYAMLLARPNDTGTGVPTWAGLLYTSHFLSAWNSRMFEFGAVLFLAAIFPGTLRPLSIYAVVRGLAAVLGAGAVGTYIDYGDRLSVVRTSILGQRAAVVVSCVLFLVMMGVRRDGDGDGGRVGGKFLLFSVWEAVPGVVPERVPVAFFSAPNTMVSATFFLALLAACVEKLCAVMNTIAVERDWVVVMTEGSPSTRRLASARLRRIDLICKLAAPLAIASLLSTITLTMTRTAIWIMLAVNLLSVAAEYFCIERVYQSVPELRRRRTALPVAAASLSSSPPRRQRIFYLVFNALLPSLSPSHLISSFRFYFDHTVVLPSLALALLYLTVLSFSGHMVTYLVSVDGFTPLIVGLTRTASSVIELSATWLAPRLMSRIGVVRCGLWSLSWQTLWLTGGVFVFWGGGSEVPADSGTGEQRRFLAASGLAIATALSRLGLWGFDLCAQSIVQDEIDDHHRGAFSTAETALQSMFEVLSYATTMVFARPDQFRWPVTISLAAVYTAAAVYAAFVRRRRGHLFHSPLPPAQRWLDKALGGRMSE